ncbi:Uncharacterized conserved protein [Chromobacterium violaceum]|uniref:Uncharacterized conserved protein n=1 Tax=Chromobacterium violaceum TaxID=536 RepID=A0A447TI98_CHRVL|nr:Uncharacterized conserved protein [Chromobacterium violaceum]
MRQLAPADLYLLAVPDAAIASCARGLAAAGVAPAGSVVFHASGVATLPCCGRWRNRAC